MKTIFDPKAYQDILRRFELLQPNTQRQWGRMTVAQMMEHNSRTLEVVTGKRATKQLFIGKLIGWMFKKRFLGEKPFEKNGRTGPDLIVADEPDFLRTKDKMRTLLNDLHARKEEGCDGKIHGFLGPLTGAEWGVLHYKHLDHHFRQFGV